MDDMSEEKRVSLIIVGSCGRVHRARMTDILRDIAIIEAMSVSAEPVEPSLSAMQPRFATASAKYHKQPEKWQRQGNKRGERIR